LQARSSLASRLFFVCIDGTELTIGRHFCIAALEFHAFYWATRGSISSSLVFAPATSNLVGKFRMSAQDLPAAAKALSVVVAIALVATALAPVIFTAARIVA
jgi:hypothetical protein